ncbi:YihY family inner membrane protein [Crenobacter cavernae]|uniref:UPF0761 membrane protein DWG20_07390 n=1 Tax=Crenobacter cavernae TaxID=2290923 RepID=A0A345YA91_9NEIS|nr:YihY family inner membrane protein [Crenobacter cavernae]AXK40843.1 YihY family inner membrane protein [Crenobacter cavernae]
MNSDITVRLAEFKRWDTWRGFGRFLLARMAQARLTQVAGSLTFTTLLALVPLFTVALIVVSAFPVFDDYSTRFKVMLLTTLVPEFAGKVFSVYLRQFADNAGKLTSAGVVMLGVTAILMMMTVERTFNTIWRVTRSRPLLSQTMVYWTVLTLGPLILGVGLGSWHWLFKTMRRQHELSTLAELLQSMGAMALTTVVLSLLYRIVPARFVPMRHALVGATLTAALMEVLKAGFRYYIEEVASYQLVYGAFASLPIFLMWLYLLWLLVLAGAVLTASLSYWEGEAWRRSLMPRRRFLDAIEVLLLLDAAQADGRPLSLPELRRAVNVGYDELGVVVDKLTLEGLAERTQAGACVLAKKLDAIRLIELFRLFVYRPDGSEDDDIACAVEALMVPLTDVFEEMTLADFSRRLALK